MKKLVKTMSIIFATSVVVVGSAVLYAANTDTKIVVSNGESKIQKGINTDYFNNLYKDNIVELKEHGESWAYTYDELGIKLKWSEELKNKVNKSFKLDIDSLDFKFEHDERLKNTIEKLNDIRRDHEYAEFHHLDNTFEIKPEVIGDKIDSEKLYLALVDVIDKDGADIYISDYYLPFDETKPKAEDFQKELDKFNNFEITYTNGFTITNENIFEYLQLKDNKIEFNNELTEKAVKDMDKLIDIGLADYDTVGGDWYFTTHDNREIIVSGGTWGDYFDSAEESKYIVEKIKKLESETNREPITSQDYADEVPNRYVEISLDEQHLWFYDNGELVAESPVVTGLKGRMDTPKGVYYISEMIDGKYLRGEDYVTWVDKWMRITNRGHGLHDASWRASREFGGSTYKWDGSHGCINLPKKFAYELYELLNVKDCVVIY